MKKYFLLCISLLMLSYSCSKSDGPIPPPDPKPTEVDRTVLAYLLGNNNLSGYLATDFRQMVKGKENIGGNLLVYFDRPNRDPELIQVNYDGTYDVVKTYTNHENSATPEALEEAIRDVQQLYPASSYGMVFSSHGMGWFPANLYARGARASVSRQPGYELPERPKPLPGALQTKYFGDDDYYNLDISEMREVLAKFSKFDFLLFDACFMSTVEVAYELKDVASYIIASPVEILANGFPYSDIVPTMFAKTLDHKKICQEFMDFYTTYLHKSAAITLINTDYMTELAGTIKDIYNEHLDFTVNVRELQVLEGMALHYFFDLDDYMAAITGKDLYYIQYQAALNKVIDFVDNTPSIYTAYKRAYFDLLRNSGMSVFVPTAAAYKQFDLEAYKETMWAKAVGID